jgi:predicted DNA-binding WGR domain protein
MARFELDDGRMQRFWEVSLDGEVLTFQYGDLGSEGRTRTKQCRSERAAKAAYDDAVRAMLQQGYRRVVAVPPAEVPDDAAPMWGRLEEDPDDPVALAVHADWLQSRGDVRGEILALELAGRQDDANAMRQERAAELMGPIDAFPGQVQCTWRNGYVRSVRFDPADHRGVDPAGAAVRVLSSNALRLVQDVVLQVPSAAQVAVARRLPSVRRLALHTGVVGGDFQPSEPLDLDRLQVCMPRLRSLKVRGVCDLVGEAVVAGLDELDIRFTPEWTDRILGARALNRLAIHGIDQVTAEVLASRGVFGQLDELVLTPSWSAMPTLLGALSSGRCAQRLVLAGMEIDAGHVHALDRLDGLEQVAFDGTVSEGALRRLELSHLVLVGQVRIRPDADDDDEEPTRPRGLQVVRLELRKEKTRRFFWEIGLDDTVHHVRYGRLGTRGTWIWRRFPTSDIAEEMMERRIDEKLRDGYEPTSAEVVYDRTRRGNGRQRPRSGRAPRAGDDPSSG